MHAIDKMFVLIAMIIINTNINALLLLRVRQGANDLTEQRMSNNDDVIPMSHGRKCDESDGAVVGGVMLSRDEGRVRIIRRGMVGTKHR